MREFTYLIIGNGMTADAAARGIREEDATGSIAIVGSEPREPYFRPPLTKSLWQGTSEDSIWCGTSEISGLHLITGRRIVEINPDAHTATDDQGEVYQWKKLLLATGGTPRKLPNTSENAVCYYRTLADYHRLKESIQVTDPSVAVIGGGFIGSEIAAALAMNDVQVAQIFPETGICGARFPKELSDYLNAYYEEKGVNVLAEDSVESITEHEDGLEIRTATGETVKAHAAVAGLGIKPDTELAEKGGLDVDNGIKVNQCLQTTHPDIYAAGDVANFYNPALDRRLRVEHDDNTQAMGQTAGKNMVGANLEYNYLPLFYSDLFDLGYEAVGETDANMEVVTKWEELGRKGVIFYMRDQRVKGVIFWNVWDMVEKGRELIAEPGPIDEAYLDNWYKEHVGS